MEIREFLVKKRLEKENRQKKLKEAKQKEKEMAVKTIEQIELQKQKDK